MGSPEDPGPLVDTLFSRSGRTSPLGKLDDRIEAFRIEGVVKAKLQLLAARRGIPLTEYLQLVLRVLTFGPSEVARMHTERVDEVADLLGIKEDKSGT